MSEQTKHFGVDQSFPFPSPAFNEQATQFATRAAFRKGKAMRKRFKKQFGGEFPADGFNQDDAPFPGAGAAERPSEFDGIEKPFDFEDGEAGFKKESFPAAGFNQDDAPFPDVGTAERPSEFDGIEKPFDFEDGEDGFESDDQANTDRFDCEKPFGFEDKDTGVGD